MIMSGMILNDFEEKILRRIHDLGPEHVYNKLFQDKKSQAAVSLLIRLKMIEPNFDISDEQVERYRRGQTPDQDAYDLHLSLTEDGRAYYDDMYKPSKIFGGGWIRVAAYLSLAAVLLWLLW